MKLDNEVRYQSTMSMTMDYFSCSIASLTTDKKLKFKSVYILIKFHTFLYIFNKDHKFFNKFVVIYAITLSIHTHCDNVKE